MFDIHNTKFAQLLDQSLDFYQKFYSMSVRQLF